MESVFDVGMRVVHETHGTRGTVVDTKRELTYVRFDTYSKPQWVFNTDLMFEDTFDWLNED